MQISMWSLTRLTRRGVLRGLGGVVGMVLLAACDDAPSAPTGAPQPTSAAPTAPPVKLPTVTPVNTTAQAQAFAQESIALVNQARNDAGLTSLTESALLTQVATAYSQRMAAEDFYGHEDPQGNDVGNRLDDADYLSQMSAENIARGQPDAATVVDGWLNSPGHRANIMNPDLTEIGAGYAYTDTPPYRHYWTHVFGTPDASVGRDQSQYPAEAIAAINQLRQAAGIAPLTEDTTLVGIATSELQTLVTAPDYEAQVEPSLDAASQAAVQTFAQVVALSAAGPATPEDVVAQWAEGNTENVLDDATYTRVGIAYHFDEQGEFRHYWLLLLAT